MTKHMEEEQVSWSDVDEVGHIKLNFNDMIISFAAKREQCHQEARFWMPWSNYTRLEAYLKMNKIAKIDCKKHFGKLVAGGIITAL